ncbi:DUF488 domain-containing protein [Aquibacillus sediminis]|uniref:DUF488 domain-containing protein n=1 Tax=Aquibacillus sediminis TaxID=2574734 RepID=UPI00110877E5|nr:DUF488 family protein [Aquibacillus sediminis]
MEVFVIEVQLKRAYQQPTSEDGVRVLVDRLWPRGVSKKEARIDYWLRQLAPSTELRKWFNHDQEKFSVFKQKYKEEIWTNQEKERQLQELQEIIKRSERVTLVYAAKDREYNQVVVLAELLNYKVVSK